MAWAAGLALVPLLAATCAAGCRRHVGPRPLFEGSRYTTPQRDAAVLRGLDFIYDTALDGDNFEEYASDYLWCFGSIAVTTSNRELENRAMFYGRELGWRLHAYVTDVCSVEPESSGRV